MSNELVTGTVVLRIDGVSIRSKQGAKLMLGGFNRKAQYADGALIGYSQEPIASEITATLAHTNASNLDALNNVTDSTILFDCDSGVQYQVNGAFSTKPPEVTGGDGDVAVTYMGQPAVQTK